MKNQNNTTHSEQLQNPFTKIEDKGKIDAPFTHIHDRSHLWLDTDTLVTEKAVLLWLFILWQYSVL